MIRRDFFARLFSAPFAALVAWRLKPEPLGLQPWQRAILDAPNPRKAVRAATVKFVEVPTLGPDGFGATRYTVEEWRAMGRKLPHE